MNPDQKLWSDEKLKMKTSKNCTISDIDKCLDANIFINFDTLKLINCGTYACVFGADESEKAENKHFTQKKYAIKCQLTIIPNDAKKLYQEIEYTYLCGKLNIGPRVYDHLYKEERFHNFPPIMKGMVTKTLENMSKKIKDGSILKKIKDGNNEIHKNLYIHTRFIIMKKYDMDCSKFLFVGKHPPNTNTKVVHKMCKLVERMVNCGIYCCDVKPDNFVVSDKPDNDDNDDNDLDGPVVRMIDFGQEFCTDYLTNKYKKSINGSMYNNTPNFTCIDMFCVSLLVLLFLMCIDICKHQPNFYMWLYQGFVDTKLSKFLRTNNWRDNITKYTLDAFKTSAYEMTPEFNYAFRVKNIIPNYKDLSARQKQQHNQYLVKLIVSNLEALDNYLNLGTTPHPSLYTLPSAPTILIKSLTPEPPVPFIKLSTPTSQLTETDSLSTFSTLPTFSTLIIGAGLTGLTGLTGYAIYKIGKLLSRPKQRLSVMPLHIKTKTKVKTKVKSRNT